MKKWFLIIIFLFAFSWLLSLTRDKSRTIASVQTSTGCFDSVSYFTKSGYSKSKFDRYYGEFKKGDIQKMETFDDSEQYLAWIEYQVGKYNISYVQYLGSMSSLKRKIYDYISRNSRPDKSLSFFFAPNFESLILKNLPIENITPVEERYLQRILREKIVSDVYKSLESEQGAFAKFFNGKYVSKVIDLFSYSPILFGMPPFKLPRILTERKSAILNAKNVDDVNSIFARLKSRDKSRLKYLHYYDIIRDKYIQFVSAFYMGYTFYTFYNIDKHIEEVEEVEEYLDDSIADLESLVNPSSCKMLDQCLEEYREDWEGQNEEAYLETKASCKLVYGITLDCV